MSYWLHPEAAQEHKKQVAHYEEIQAGLGARYHAEFLSTLEWVCASPDRFRIVLSPDIRRAMFKVFHFDVIWHSPKSVDKYYCQNLNWRNANAKSQIHT